jgi:hypothetical protein
MGFLLHDDPRPLAYQETDSDIRKKYRAKYAVITELTNCWPGITLQMGDHMGAYFSTYKIHSRYGWILDKHRTNIFAIISRPTTLAEMDLIAKPYLDVGNIPFSAWCLRICSHWFTMIFSSNGGIGNLILLFGKPDNAKIKQNCCFNHGTGHLCVRPVTCACTNCGDWHHYLGHSGGYQDCSSDT